MVQLGGADAPDSTATLVGVGSGVRVAGAHFFPLVGAPHDRWLAPLGGQALAKPVVAGGGRRGPA